MPSIYLRGANTTAQWYADNFPGSTFSRLDKFLIHTTETGGWPGYSAGASAPNATYYPKWRQIRQHFGINRSARALRDPSWTAVRENRDNVFQLEIICYSDYRLARERGGLWVGDLSDAHMQDIAAMILQIHQDWGLPIQSSVTWREGRQTYYNDVRLSGPQFDAYRGILGHVHASGNDHWDPGGFRYSKLVKALQYQLVNHPVYGSGGVTIPPPPTGGVFDPEEEVALTAEDKEWFRYTLRAIMDEKVFHNVWFTDKIPAPTGYDTSKNPYWTAANVARSAQTYAHLAAGKDVDEGALAAAIAAALPSEVNITQEQLEAALRNLLGSLNDAPA